MPQQQEQPQDMSMGQNTAQQSPQLSTGMPLSNDALGQKGANGMSSDDLAAALGYITTLSEHMFHGQPDQPPQDPNKGNPGDSQQSNPQDNTSPEDPKEEQKHNDEQDKEIEDIKKQLEQLLQEQDGKDTKDTTTAQ